jgi:hypothetical protein
MAMASLTMGILIYYILVEISYHCFWWVYHFDGYFDLDYSSAGACKEF